MGRKDVLKALILDAAGDFEHVNARSLELRGEVKHFIQGVAARLTLGTGDTQHDREIAADVAAALFNDLQDQRARLSMQPPYSSMRLLRSGLRNAPGSI